MGWSVALVSVSSGCMCVHVYVCHVRMHTCSHTLSLPLPLPLPSIPSQRTYTTHPFPKNRCTRHGTPGWGRGSAVASVCGRLGKSRRLADCLIGRLRSRLDCCPIRIPWPTKNNRPCLAFPSHKNTVTLRSVFVKFGQYVGGRADMVPPAWAAALSLLQVCAPVVPSLCYHPHFHRLLLFLSHSLSHPHTTHKKRTNCPRAPPPTSTPCSPPNSAGPSPRSSPPSTPSPSPPPPWPKCTRQPWHPSLPTSKGKRTWSSRSSTEGSPP